MKGDGLYMNNNYIETLGAKIEEAKLQLSIDAQKYIKNNNDDLYTSAMDYIYKIETRFFMNPTDEQDYNLLNSILNLIDLIMELLPDYEDFETIVIDED